MSKDDPGSVGPVRLLEQDFGEVSPMVFYDIESIVIVVRCKPSDSALLPRRPHNSRYNKALWWLVDFKDGVG